MITRGGTTQYHGQIGWLFPQRRPERQQSSSPTRRDARGRSTVITSPATILGGPGASNEIAARGTTCSFSASQEYQNQVVSYSVNEKTVPTALERQGRLLEVRTIPTAQSLSPPYDPLAQVGTTRVLFPGRVIPASRITPAGHAILNMFPLPNFVRPRLRATGTTGITTWRRPSRTTAAPNPLRADYQPKPQVAVYVSLSSNYDHQNVPYSGGTAGWVAGSLNFRAEPDYLWGSRGGWVRSMPLTPSQPDAVQRGFVRRQPAHPPTYAPQIRSG